VDRSSAYKLNIDLYYKIQFFLVLEKEYYSDLVSNFKWYSDNAMNCIIIETVPCQNIDETKSIVQTFLNYLLIKVQIPIDCMIK